MESSTTSDAKTLVIFSPIEDEAGSLAKALKIFEEFKVNLTHIESRSSLRGPGYEFMVECNSNSTHYNDAIEELRESSGYFQVISRDYNDNEVVPGLIFI